MKVHTGNGINTQPDVSVVCGDRCCYLGRTDVILNPLLIVEVLSPSTEGYDRTENFDHYQTIESPRDDLLVEQDETRVLLYSRREDHWEMRVVTGREETIFLTSVQVSLAMMDVYAKINFGNEPL